MSSSAGVKSHSARDVAEALRRHVRTIVQDLGSRFFDRAAATLDQSARDARSDYTRRLIDDAAGCMRSNRNRLETEFLLACVRSKQTSAAEPVDDSLETMLLSTERDADDERQEMGSLAASIEIECFAVLGDIQSRLESLRETGERMLDITPLAFLDAFRSSLDLLDLDRGSRMVLFNAFAQHFLAGLPPYYAAILESLNRSGVASAAQPDSELVFAAPSRPSLELDEWLQPGVKDAMLTLELASAKLSDPDLLRDLARRAAMAGVLFEGLLKAMPCPRPAAATVMSLRPIVVRAVVPQRTFFTDPQHPLRDTLHQVALQAGLVGLDAASATAQFDELVERLQRSCSESVALSVEKCGQPLTPTETMGFRLNLTSQQDARRVAIDGKSKFWSCRMMYNLISATKLPDKIAEHLTRVWPGVVHRALRIQGRDGAAWERMVALTDRLMSSLAPADGRVASMRREVLDAIVSSGATASDAETWFDRLIDSQRMDPTPAKSVPPSLQEMAGGIHRQKLAPARNRSAEEILAPFLKPAIWYHITVAPGDRRWMALQRWYREVGQISFSDFAGKTTIAFDYGVLMQMVGRGDAVPFTMPTEDLEELLRLLGRA